MPSPTGLTLAHLRKNGFLPTVVERWLPRVNRRADAFGFADILAIDLRQPGLLLVQCTSLHNVSSRLAKARSKPELAAWLKAGGKFWVMGWYKRAGAWRVKVVEIRAGDLQPIPLQQPARRGRKSRQPELPLFD